MRKPLGGSLAVLVVLWVGCGAGLEVPGAEVLSEDTQTQRLSSSPQSLSGDFRWAQVMSGPSEETAAGVAHDKDGNIIVTALFQTQLSDSAGTIGTSTKWASVLTKYRPNGNRVWARTVPARVTALTVNPSRHVFITGTFEGTIHLGGAPLSVGEFLEGIFFAEYNANGVHIWSRAFPLEYFSFFGARMLRTDSQGNLAVAGLLRGAIYFGNGTVVADSTSVLFRLSPRGVFQWASVEAGFGDAGGVAVDEDDNLYLAGTSITDLYPPLERIPFVNKFSPTGTRLWQRKLGTVTGSAQSVGVHGNRVVLTGTFESPLTFGDQTFLPKHTQDGFLLAFTRDGETRWARQLGREGLDVAFDHLDDLVVVGRYQDRDDLGLGPLVGVPGSEANLFAAKFGRVDGTPRWTQGFSMAQPPGVSISVDRFRVSVDELGRTAFLGGLVARLDVGPTSLFPTGVRDVFLMSLLP